MMTPVALAENHPMCRTNREGERVLPNGQVWMPQLLLLCFASKILTEANALLNLQEQNAKAAKAAAQQQKVPPLPFLLSSLITSRKPLKLEGGDDEADGGEGEERAAHLGDAHALVAALGGARDRRRCVPCRGHFAGHGARGKRTQSPISQSIGHGCWLQKRLALREAQFLPP